MDKGRQGTSQSTGRTLGWHGKNIRRFTPIGLQYILKISDDHGGDDHHRATGQRLRTKTDRMLPG